MGQEILSELLMNAFAQWGDDMMCYG